VSFAQLSPGSQRLARVDASRVAEQSGERVELAPRELHLKGAPRGAPGVEVELKRASPERGRLGLEAAGAA
jgi:hypothetical protein